MPVNRAAAACCTSAEAGALHSPPPDGHVCRSYCPPLMARLLRRAHPPGSFAADPRIFMSARVGSSAVLPCDCLNVSGSSPHVEWRTISETVFEREGEETYQGEGFKGRVDIPEDKLLKGNCSL
ncbi:hypothetical protein NFI96_015844 [Prochilodus magdalenae]|nr:hypothetical protein NFI96_015844 [Prochilodus magdalenae]